MKLYMAIVTCSITILLSNIVEAFDHKETHPLLTRKALFSFELDSFFKVYLGFPTGFKSNIYGPTRNSSFQYQTISQWLQIGSKDEDALSTCRASSHFHNPIHSGDWTQSQMSDSKDIDLVCGISNRYSDVTWATGYTYPAPGGSKITPIGQTNSWDNARQYYYNALTTTDTYSSMSKDNLFVLTFRSLGMVMHLLQDMAVPAHVRNDMQSHLWNNLNPLKWSNPFEKYVIKKFSAINNIPVTPPVSSFTRLTDFWDTNIYNGIEPDSTRYEGIGLAEYTNANFLSDFTIFNQNPTSVHYFPYPSSSSVSIEYRQIVNPFLPATLTSRPYYVKTSDGEVGYLLAGVNYFDVKAPGILPNTTKKIPPMDDNVHAAYAERLLPRAVGYSAALLDYFFRGTINLTVNPSDITFNNIKVTASNSTANETMGIGDVTLVLRYKPLTESGTGAVKTLDFPLSTTGYSYKVATLANVDMSVARTLTFDFTGNTLPTNYTDMTIQLVFKGKLGNEEGAVAVSAPKAVTGIYSALNLALPAAGVYTKIANNSLAATFSEMRVNVNNNTAIHLTGGSFELTMRYRTASNDPFQSQQVSTEPSGAYAYIVRYTANSGSSTLPIGYSADIVFDLSSVPISVKSTDVEMFVTYKSGSNQPVAVGYRDISEPTPVDLFNNTDYTCINSQWFNAGDSAPILLADQFGNNNGLDDDLDSFRHNFTNMYVKLSSAQNPESVSSSNYTFTDAGPLLPGSLKRFGYILTDYSYSQSFVRSLNHIDSKDGYTGTNAVAAIEPMTAFRNQTNLGYPLMYNMRGNQMWGGAIFDNRSSTISFGCNWNQLPLP